MQKHRKILLLFIGLFAAIAVYTPVLIFESFRLDYAVECPGIGFGGVMGMGYLRYKALLSISPNAIAKVYAKSDNPVLKTYAAQLLCRRGNSRCLELFRAHAASGETVLHKCGCLGSQEKISDVMYGERRSYLRSISVDSLSRVELLRSDEILNTMVEVESGR